VSLRLLFLRKVGALVMVIEASNIFPDLLIVSKILSLLLILQLFEMLILCYLE